MYKEMTTKILSQFLIGNVYLELDEKANREDRMCQFLIGNVYQELTCIAVAILGMCQFLIGNVYLVKHVTLMYWEEMDCVNSL